MVVVEGVPSSRLERAESPVGQGLRRFSRNRIAAISAILLIVIVLIVTIGPIFYGVDPNAVDPALYRLPPSPEHPLGTDSAGRDSLARLLAGGQISLMVGLGASLLAAAVGLVLGAAAGYRGGRIDSVLSRVTDIFLAFPTFIVLLVLAAIVGPSVAMLVVTIGLLEWTTTFRVVRGVALSLRERESVQAAQGMGGTHSWVLFRHILPGLLAPMTVATTLLVANVILLETSLSFLGLGVPPPTASWGNMLTEAQSLTTMEFAPWLWIPAGAAIAITVLAVNFIGDGLRDAFEPKGVA